MTQRAANMNRRTAMSLLGAAPLTFAISKNAILNAATPGHAVFAIAAFPAGLDVAFSTGRGSTVTHQIIDTLTWTNHDTKEIEPYLATGWEVLDDARRFTFTLRDGVTFSDGSPFTAQSVKNNFDKLAELSREAVTDTAVRSALAHYTGAEVKAPNVVEVTFAIPQLGFLRNASDPYFGFYADATLALPVEARTAGELIGTGPFVFERIVRNETVALVAREDYNWAPPTLGHQGRAKLDRLTFRAVPESGVRAGLLASGQADFIDDVAVEDEPLVAASGTLIWRTGPGLLPGLRQNPYSRFGGDLAVRQALSKAVNRAEIRDALLSAQTSELVAGVVGTTTPLFADQSDLLGHDIAGARAILEAAGWSLGTDGIYEKDGTRLSLVVSFAQNSLVATRLELELLQAQVRQAGIEIVLLPQTAAEFSAAINGIAAAGRDNAVYDFLSGSAPSKDISFLVGLFKSSNPALGGAEQPELEAAADLLAGAPTAEARQAAAEALQNLLARDGYWIPIKQNTKVVGAAPHTSGFVLDAFAAPSFYAVTVG